MKKLNSYSRHIYQTMSRSSKKTKTNLTREDSVFNSLLRDWLYDAQVAGIAIDQNMLNTQCGLFKVQAQRIAISERLDETEDEGVDWPAIGEALDDIDFQWSTRVIESTRTVRVKVTGLVSCNRMNKETIEMLRQALSGDHFEEYETLSFVACSVERNRPIPEHRIAETEEFCQNLAREHVLALYLGENPYPDAEVQQKIRGNKPLGKISMWWRRFQLLNW